MKGTCASIVLIGCLTAMASPTHAAVVWDESIHGDLSGDHTAPTGPVNLAPGSNEVHGTTISGDRDYITLVVPAGLQLSQIMVLQLTGDNLAFIGLQAGSQVTDPAGANPAADLLGYTHVGSSAGNIGTNILDDMSTAAGAQGFSPPLGAGTYSVWMQETGGVEVTYGYDFILTQVPAPGAIGLFIVAGFAASGRRRRS